MTIYDVVEIGTNISTKIYNRLRITGNFKIKKKVLNSIIVTLCLN